MTGTPTYISTNTTTQVFTGAGKLLRLILTETAAGAITIYDNTSAAGTPKIVFKASIAEQSFEIGAEFKVGLCIVTAASSKLTVITG